jgi:hypothetical protein
MCNNAVVNYIQSNGACLESEVSSSRIEFGDKTDLVSNVLDNIFTNWGSTYSVQSDELISAVSAIFPKSDLSSLRLPIEGSDIIRLNRQACETKQKFNHFEVHNGYSVNDIDDLLDKQKTALIGFDFEMISNNISGAHAGLVVGRHYDLDRSQCMYVVKNSWGLRPDGISDTGVEFRAGFLHVPKAKLMDFIRSVSWRE